MSEESTATVVVAIAANLGIAVAKGVAGALSGSAAMISECAHSLADTTNEALLLVAVKRSQRPADERHQFGYGRERYFWTLLAAVGTFAGAAAVSGRCSSRSGPSWVAGGSRCCKVSASCAGRGRKPVTSA